MQWQEQEARDLEQQREIQQAFDEYVNAPPAERDRARERYRAVFKAFADRVLGRK